MVALCAAIVLACGAGAGLIWARRCLLVVTVQGPSMEPTLHEGDRVLARRVSLTALRTGHLVVIRRPPPWRTVESWHAGQLVGPEGCWPDPTRTPPDHWMIKRVAAVGGEALPEPLASAAGYLGAVVPPGCFAVLGDNADRSVDSRRFGYLDASAVLGVVIRPRRRTDTGAAVP